MSLVSAHQQRHWMESDSSNIRASGFQQCPVVTAVPVSDGLQAYHQALNACEGRPDWFACMGEQARGRGA